MASFILSMMSAMSVAMRMAMTMMMMLFVSMLVIVILMAIFALLRLLRLCRLEEERNGPGDDLREASSQLLEVIPTEAFVRTVGVGLGTKKASDNKSSFRPFFLEEIHEGDGATLTH